MKKLFYHFFHHPLVVLFTLIVFGATVIDLVKPDKHFSELENKFLTSKPTFSISNFVDGTFSKNYVNYINDQFVARDEWISMKALAESAQGKNENNGVLLGKDRYLFEKLQVVENKPDNSGTNVVEQIKLEKSLRIVKEFFEMYDLPMTFALVPNSYEIMSDKLPANFNRLNQQEMIPKFYTELADPKVDFLNFCDVLNQHKAQPIYYRTDHHWTTLGAYYAYTEYCNAKGLTPVDLDSLATKEAEGFYGTFYSKAKLPSIEPDTITLYDIPVEQFAFHTNIKDQAITSKGTIVEEDGLQLLSVRGMYDEDKLTTRDKYAAFTWGNSGYVKIKSANNLNPRDEPSRLLLIKDSYANSMIPFLTYNYDEIYVIDLRSAPRKLSQILKSTNFNDVFVMYNFSTFIGDSSNLSNLKS